VLIGFQEVWFIVRYNAIVGEPIDDNAGVIGSGDTVAVIHFVFLEERLNFGGMGDGYYKFTVDSLLPGIVAHKEPGNIAHIFHL
jgi:hypothetical protein